MSVPDDADTGEIPVIPDPREIAKVTASALEAVGVSLRVARVTAVDDVSLIVEPGETLGLLGARGAGKSLLAGALAGTLTPSSGTVKRHGRAQLIVAGATESLNPRRAVAGSVAEALIAYGLHAGTEPRRRRVDQLLERVGIDPALGTCQPAAFTPEQRLRIVLARTLAAEPRVVIADDPFTGIDVTAQAGVIALLHELRAELDLTLVLATGDVAVARYMCDRIAVLDGGRLVELAAVDDLFTRPRHAHSAALISAVPVPNLSR